MFIAWRLFYALIASPPVTAATAMAFRLVRLVFGEHRAEGLLAAADRRLARSGWPYHSKGWTNLHMARWLMRVRRGPAQRRPPRPPFGAGNRRLRVGIIGPFSGLLGFPARLFQAFPPAAELTIFDYAYGDRYASYLRPLAAQYVAMPRGSSSAEVFDAAGAIEREDVDLLVNVLAKRPVFDLMDRLHVRCIAHYCNGSEPLYHDAVDFQLYPQQEADYFVAGSRLFCTTTMSWFSHQPFFPVTPYYDVRDIDPVPPCWRQREPVIVYHGSLYKLANPGYLAVLFQLLREDRVLRLVVMGKDDSSALATIRAEAAKHDVASQVHYCGHFGSTRNAEGAVDDPGWAHTRQLLARARLAANPWPIGGGSSRVEAYAAGVPCIAVRLSFDKSAWNRPQLVTCDVPAIHSHAGTATTASEYLELSRRCLYDDRFFERVVSDQRTALQGLTDAPGWWARVFVAHDRWKRGTGAGLSS
jgi:glycosyltransferase involved in cell wall biosynthesis